MSTTTIKVPVELRDRLAELAKREHTTLSGAIERSLDQADAAAFWADVRRTMHGPGSPAEEYAGTLTDGLDPDESWDDIL